MDKICPEDESFLHINPTTSEITWQVRFRLPKEKPWAGIAPGLHGQFTVLTGGTGICPGKAKPGYRRDASMAALSWAGIGWMMYSSGTCTGVSCANPSPPALPPFATAMVLAACWEV